MKTDKQSQGLASSALMAPLVPLDRRGLLMKALPVAAGVALTGCYGSFGLTKRVYQWNGQATDNKWVNSAITLVLVPIYGLAGAVDYMFFNVIEFYTGDNPVALNEDGSAEMRYAGVDYRLNVTDEGSVRVEANGEPAIEYRQLETELVVTNLKTKTTASIPLSEAHAKAQPMGMTIR